MTCTQSCFQSYATQGECIAAVEEMVKRAMSWALELEINLGIRAPPTTKKSKAKPLVIGLNKRLLQIEKRYSARTLPRPGDIDKWEPKYAF